MTELYMRLLDRVLTPILLLLTIFLLLRGHDLPGGGFIAALMASAAFYLQILSRGSNFVRDELGRYLQPGIGIGLLMASVAALLGYLWGGYFVAGWGPAISLGSRRIKLSTPLLFDIGVFVTVVCFAVSYLLGLSDSMTDVGSFPTGATSQPDASTSQQASSQ